MSVDQEILVDPAVKQVILQNGFKDDVATNNNNIAKSNGEVHDVKEDTQAKVISTEQVPDHCKPTENFSTCQPDGCVKLRDSLEESFPPVTVPSLLAQIAEKYPQNPALAYKPDDDAAQWKFIDFQEYLKTVRCVAKAFLKLGLQRYHAVCILGKNTPEWFISDLAAIFAGGFASGIYTTNSAEACLHCLNLSAANIVIVENDSQLQKILQIKDNTTEIKAIIQYTGKPTVESVLSWDDLLEIGNQQPDQQLDSMIKSLAVNECCSLLFTSGTTGPPKAVMLSHDNLVFATKSLCKYLRPQEGRGRLLSYLPLSHAAAQIADLFIGIVAASCVYFGDKNVLKGSLVDNLKSIKPTLFFGVPRIWEKMKEGLEASEKNASTLQKCILSYAKSAAIHHYKELANGNESESVTYKLFRRIVYSKVKQKLGLDKCELCLVGAAPPSPAVREYLSSFDISVGEIFGMSETAGPHLASHGADVDLSSSGKSMPGVKTKINKPDGSGIGEVCMYGRNTFMGYLGDWDKTKEAVDEDGWLHSGDTGKCDEKSSICIIGRIKELLITSGGENVAPVLIEIAIKTELPIVSQALIIGDGRKFLSALLTLKSEVNADTGEPQDELCPEVKRWCAALNCHLSNVSDIIRDKPEGVYNAIQEGIEKVNRASISQAQRIRKFTILPKDFALITGELGPTMKIIRKAVYDKYTNEIESMYQC